MALYPDHEDFEKKKEIFAERLEPLASRAQRLGVPLLLEPLNRYETYFMLTLGQAAETCRMLDNPAVRVMADLFHMGIEENDPVAALEEHGGYVKHVHLVDTNRRLPGEGAADFRPVAEVLKKTGFEGYLCMECGITGDPEEEVPRAAALARKIFG